MNPMPYSGLKTLDNEPIAWWTAATPEKTITFRGQPRIQKAREAEVVVGSGHAGQIYGPKGYEGDILI